VIALCALTPRKLRETRECAEAQSEGEITCTLFVILHYFIFEIALISRGRVAELEIFIDRTDRREIGEGLFTLELIIPVDG
jgi:hypothetical protein